MEFLLDTHIFLWFLAGDIRLKPSMKARVCDPANRRLLSIVSLWEIVVKTSIGKLPSRGPISQFIRDYVDANDIQILEFKVRHLDQLEALPYHHRDPFDRLIVAQALGENLELMSADATLDAYGIQRMW